MTTYPTLADRDVQDMAANRPHNTRVLDLQQPTYDRTHPNTWSTAVFVNQHDAKIVLRQHASGTTRIKVTPVTTIDGVQPEPYEITLTPDVPFQVVTSLLEVVR